MTYDQKAMVLCELSCVDRAWSAHQLSQELQRIVIDQQSHFLGEPVIVSCLLEDQVAYV